MQNNSTFNGFEPIYDSQSKVLILGSFPSVKSREVGFYYGNKQNRFWKMLSKVFDEDIGDSTKDKINFLLKHNISLWDVVESSDLVGSMDNSLLKSHNKKCDINRLLPPNTKVEKILCNGKTSYNLLMQNFNTNIPIIYVPSTSPANVNYKFDIWNKELMFLKTN